MTTEKTTVKFPVEMTIDQRDEIDLIASELGLARVQVIRLACRDYARRFFLSNRHIEMPIGIENMPEPADAAT